MSETQVVAPQPLPAAGAEPPRRRLLKAGAAAIVSAPYIGNAAAAETTVWKIQTSWPAGVGLQTFKNWCGTSRSRSLRTLRASLLRL